MFPDSYRDCVKTTPHVSTKMLQAIGILVKLPTKGFLVLTFTFDFINLHSVKETFFDFFPLRERLRK